MWGKMSILLLGMHTACIGEILKQVVKRLNAWVRKMLRSVCGRVAEHMGSRN